MHAHAWHDGTPRSLGRRARLLLAAMPLVVAASACSTSGPAPEQSPGQVTVDTSGLSARAAGPLGVIVTTATGMSVYALVGEHSATTSCTGSCVAAWPYVTGTAATVTPPLSAALVGHTQIGGASVLTYGGHPLHTYVGDATAGAVDGQAVQGTWFVISPAGHLVRGH